MKNNKKFLIIIAFIVLILIVFLIIYLNINNSKDTDDNNEHYVEDESELESYNVNFNDLENSKIENDTKVNISDTISAEQKFSDKDMESVMYKYTIQNMKIWGDKNMSYVSIDVSNVSDKQIPECSLDIYFYRNNGKDFITVLNVSTPELEPYETKTVTYKSIDDVTNADYYDIS